MWVQGMALGLFISREIILLRGGDIKAEFPPEGGTRVVISLPGATQTSQKPAIIRDYAKNLPPSALVASGRRIGAADTSDRSCHSPAQPRRRLPLLSGPWQTDCH